MSETNDSIEDEAINLENQPMIQFWKQMRNKLKKTNQDPKFGMNLTSLRTTRVFKGQDVSIVVAENTSLNPKVMVPAILTFIQRNVNLTWLNLVVAKNN